MVFRFRTLETMTSPPMMAGRSQPMVLINGLMATRTGYWKNQPPFPHALCAGGDHILLSDLIQQRPSENADEARGSGSR